MDFKDYAREWVIKNIIPADDCGEDVLELCEKYSFGRAIKIAEYFLRLLHDYKRNDESFYSIFIKR